MSRSPAQASALPITPNGVGAVLVTALALVGAFLLGSDVLFAFGVLIAVLLIGSAALVFAPVGRVRVRRAVPESTLNVGDRATVRRVLTGGVTAQLGGARDALPSALRRLSESGPVRDRTTTLLALRRGVHDIGPTVLRLRDPFGFFERTLGFGDTAAITVLPERVELTTLTSLLAADRDGSGSLTMMRAGTSAEDLSARPYASGDSIRRVNWRATAHRDELMVRQEEEPTAPRAVLLLDTDAAHWGEADADGVHAGFERAVALVAAAIDVLGDRGYRIHVIAPGSLDLRVDGREAQSGQDEALRALAAVGLSPDAEPHLPHHPAALIAALGTLDDAAAQRWAALGRDVGTAIALLPLGADASALARLRDSGWQCRADTVAS